MSGPSPALKKNARPQRVRSSSWRRPEKYEAAPTGAAGEPELDRGHPGGVVHRGPQRARAPAAGERLAIGDAEQLGERRQAVRCRADPAGRWRRERLARSDDLDRRRASETTVVRLGRLERHGARSGRRSASTRAVGAGRSALAPPPETVAPRHRRASTAAVTEVGHGTVPVTAWRRARRHRRWQRGARAAPSAKSARSPLLDGSSTSMSTSSPPFMDSLQMQCRARSRRRGRSTRPSSRCSRSRGSRRGSVLRRRRRDPSCPQSPPRPPPRLSRRRAASSHGRRRVAAGVDRRALEQRAARAFDAHL